MNCFQIEVRGVTFTIWAPTLREAVETFMIDMDFFEVPKELVACEPVREFNMPDNIPAGFQYYFLDFLCFHDNILM